MQNITTDQAEQAAREAMVRAAYGGRLPGFAGRGGQRSEIILATGLKRCSTCKLWLTLDRFHAAAERSGGVASQCAPCHSGYLKTRDERLRASPAELPEGRICTKCGNWKSGHEFYITPGNRLHPNCKECFTAATRAREHAKGVRPHQPAVVDGRKRCTRCQEWKPVDDFHRGKKQIRSICKECARPITRAWHRSDRARDLYYRKTYGVGLDWYNAQFAEQNGVCWICERPADPNYRPHPRLVIDHDHDTGRVRGLLDHKCNSAIGIAHHDVARLRGLIGYLGRYPLPPVDPAAYVAVALPGLVLPTVPTKVDGKVCTRCDTWKPASEFYGRADGKGGGLYSCCKRCWLDGVPAKMRKRVEIVEGTKRCSRCGEWRALDRFGEKKGNRAGTGQIKAWCRPCEAAWMTSDAGRNARYALKFGVTLEWYEAKLAQQGGTCGACGRLPGSKRLAIDHNHACCGGLAACGRCVRGLLCRNCNTALGLFGDNADHIERAIKYLEFFG